MITSAQIAQQHNAFSSGVGINPAAYQDQVFGGITPFGTGFGNSMAMGSMGGFKSTVDTGLLAGMGALGANWGLGKMGLGQSPMLSGAAKWMGAKLPVGITMGPVMAAQAAMGQMVKGAEQGHAVEQQMNRFAGNRMNMGGPMGFGVNRRAAQELTQSMRTMSDIPEMFTSMGELTKIMSKINDMNLLQGARNAGDFKRKFSGMVKALREMSKDLGSTMEEALPFLQSSVNQGFLNNTEQVRNVRLLQASSGMGIGVGRGTLNQMQQFGADTLRNMGGDSRFGASGMRQISNQLSVAQQMGIVSQGDITRITGKVGEEGNRAASQMLFGAQTKFMQSSGAGRLFTAGLAQRDKAGNFTGRLDEERLRKFRAGDISMDDINSLGRNSLTGENAVSFENAMASGMGAEAGSQLGTAGLASAINQVLRDKNITSVQAQRRMVAKMTGLRQDMADKLLDIAKNSKQLMINTTNQAIESTARSMMVANYKENQTLSGMFTKMGTSLSATFLSPAQRIGNEMRVDLAEAGDEYARNVSRRRGVGKVLEAVTGIPRMAGRFAAKTFGGGQTGLGATYSQGLSKEFAEAAAMGDVSGLVGADWDAHGGTRDASGRMGDRLMDTTNHAEHLGLSAGLTGNAFLGRSGMTALLASKLPGAGGLASTRLAGSGIARNASGRLMAAGMSGMTRPFRLGLGGAAKSMTMGAKIVRAGATVAGGAARVIGGTALRALTGPVGWVLAAAELSMYAYDMYEDHQDDEKVKSWARSAGVSEEDAIKAFKGELQDSQGFISTANENMAKKIKAGGYVPGQQGNDAGMDADYKKAYDALVVSGQMSNILSQGGGQFEVNEKIEAALKDAGVDTEKEGRTANILNALSKGYDASGKKTSIRTSLGQRMTESLAGRKKLYTREDAVQLEKLQGEVNKIFTSDFKSETGRDIMRGGTSSKKEALAKILEDPKYQAALRNASDAKSFKRQFKGEFDALSDEEIMSLKEDLATDLESDRSWWSTDSYAEQMADRQKELKGFSKKASEVALLANAKEMSGKMSTVREAGSVIREMTGGKELGELLEDDSKGIFKSGRAALDLVRNMRSKGFDMGKMEEGRAKQYLRTVIGINKKMDKKSWAGKDEETLRKELKSAYQVSDKFLDSFLGDDDSTLGDDELEKLTEGLATQGGLSHLLDTPGRSKDELRLQGGKEGITARYLKAAEDAAKGHESFVRAVYQSKTHAGIQEQVQKIGKANKGVSRML
jgi:hypothetical protein